MLKVLVSVIVEVVPPTDNETESQMPVQEVLPANMTPGLECLYILSSSSDKVDPPVAVAETVPTTQDAWLEVTDK